MDRTPTEEAFWVAEQAKRGGSVELDGREANSPDQKPFSIESTRDYIVQYLGMISGVQRGTDELVNLVDEQKRSGNIAWSASVQHDSILLILNKYGIKITDMNRAEVFLRVPMHEIGWVLHYTEDSDQQVIVIETGDPKTGKFKYFLYQCGTEAQAENMCRTIQEAFNMVYDKAILENV